MSRSPAVQRVLVADDDPAIRSLLVYNLEAEGLEVRAVDNGGAVQSAAIEHEPDLIVLDVMMPEMDGLTALRRLRENPRTEAIPVVLLTAKATDAEVWEGWEAGADYYITKPFDMDEILHFVKYLSVEDR